MHIRITRVLYKRESNISSDYNFNELQTSLSKKTTEKLARFDKRFKAELLVDSFNWKVRIYDTILTPLLADFGTLTHIPFGPHNAPLLSFAQASSLTC